MSKISVKDLYRIINRGLAENEILIDVRSVGECKAGTIPGAVNMPLDDIDKVMDDLLTYNKVYIHCQSGNRSSKACVALHQIKGPKIIDIDGGLTAWQEAGYKVEKQEKNRLSIIRQVHIIASFLGILGLVLGFILNEWFYLLSLLVFFGLGISGLTGFCGMAMILVKAPWNK